MKRKTLAILTAAAMAAGSLSAGVCVYAADDATHIYVLTAPEDHGWTGSVATFAKEKVEEVNNDGKYTAELITSANAAEQIVNIEDIVASGEDNIAVVIQPIDDTVQSAIQQGSTCLVVLWILLSLIGFHVRGFHPLRPAFPKPFC